MPDSIIEKSKEKIRDLIAYWKEIELWIKKAEQINKRAVIPAINELRYASRQLVNAISILDKGEITREEGVRVRRHLMLAEQYLINADHDVADSITTFLAKIVESIDLEIGPASMAQHFPGYPAYRDLLDRSDELIAESREDYTKRRQIYDELRSSVIPGLIVNYKKFKESEILARHAAINSKINAARYGLSTVIANTCTVISTILTVLTVYVMVETWQYAMSGYCSAGKSTLLSSLCSSDSGKNK